MRKDLIREKEQLLGDESKRRVTEVLDEEFAAETGGEAVTDYALADRILKAVLAPPEPPAGERLRERLLSDPVLDAATGAAYTQPISSNRREDTRAAFDVAERERLFPASLCESCGKSGSSGARFCDECNRAGLSAEDGDV